MSNTSTKTRNAADDFQCHECSRTVAKGSEYVNVKWVLDGVWHYKKYCMACFKGPWGSIKWVHAQKEHWCKKCRKKIRKNELHVSGSMSVNRKMQNYRLCEKCFWA